MTRTLADSLSKKALAATLAGALALTTAGTAPARADDNADALAAAAFFGLVATAIIASSRNKDRHTPSVAPRRQLPAACRFVIHHGPDRGTWYGQRCLIENYAYWQHLPDYCAQWVDPPRRHRDVIAYDAVCLANSGERPVIGRGNDRGRYDLDPRDRH